MAEMQDRALDWDEVTEAKADDTRWELLKEGYYPFTVVKMDKERYKGSAKLPACPVAKLTLMVEDVDAKSMVFERLYLTDTRIGKVAKFFEAIGSPKNENGNTIINWNAAEGGTGWLKLKIRKYEYNGEQRESNDVAFFCAPSEHEKAYNAYAAAHEDTPAPQQAAPAPTYDTQTQQAAPMPMQQTYAPQPGTAPAQQAMPGMPAPTVQTQGAHPGWSIS